MPKINLTLVLSFLSGLLLGWLALGWWLWPVAYVGEAYTYELNQADKLRYTEAVVTSYAATGVADPAWFSGWYADEIQQAMEQVAQVSPAKANWARALENQANAVQPVQVKAQNQASGINSEGLSIVVVITLALVIAASGFWLLWRSRAVNPEPTRGFETAFVNRTTPTYVEQQETYYVPLRQPSGSPTRASLTFGPNQSTDQHLPIERDGQHLGEFGVSQVEGTQAWDVWLFDHKALATVTKVLSDEVDGTLDGRGEYLTWKEPFSLETTNLKMSGMAVKLLEGGIRVELNVEGKKAE